MSLCHFANGKFCEWKVYIWFVPFSCFCPLVFNCRCRRLHVITSLFIFTFAEDIVLDAVMGGGSDVTYVYETMGD